MDTKEVCGTCQYRKYDYEEKDYICKCEDSEAYACGTLYNDYCSCWEEKEK